MKLGRGECYFLHFFFQQNTPLHLVAKEGYLDVVRYIVDKGADVNVRNHCGVSAYNHPVIVVYIQ